MLESSLRKAPIPLRDQRAAGLQAQAEVDKNPEAIQRIWESKKDLVLLADEHKRLKAGLDLLGQMEASPELRFEEVPGLSEAEELVDAFKDVHPGKSTSEILPLIQEHLDNTLRSEINGAKNEGLPVPSAEEAVLIKEYLDVENDTKRIIRGLEDLGKTPPARTKESARAQHFMARVPTEDPTFARVKANEKLRLKKTELKKSGILIP